MSLKKELEKLKLDKRVVDFHINRGLLKKEDYEKHLQSLPDSAGNVQESNSSDTQAADPSETAN